MAKVPAFVKAFAGRWRIVETDVWDNDFLDEVEEAHITFQGGSDGEIAFGALNGGLDVRYGSRDGSAYAEFSWEGFDDSKAACGRGWATRALPVVSQATSISIKATTQPSSANGDDFFNTLLEALVSLARGRRLPWENVAATLHCASFRSRHGYVRWQER